MADAFFTQDGTRFSPTELARGPWSNDHQHGGPPAALLGRAIERLGPGFHVARTTIELLRPVPLAPLEVRASVAKPGRTVERAEASLFADGVLIASASALRIRTREVAIAEASPAPDARGPDSFERFEFPFFQHPIGYHRAVDARFARRKWGDRSVTVWMRPTAELVLGETTSALQRVLILVDAESGVCPPLDPMRHTFVNPDLTLYLERPLEGEWLGMDIRSAAHANGVGLAESLLFDAKGALGRAAQSLVVASR